LTFSIKEIVEREIKPTIRLFYPWARRLTGASTLEWLDTKDK